MENIYPYLFLLGFIIVAFLVVKRVASCLVKSVVTIVVLAVLAYVYYVYLR